MPVSITPRRCIGITDSTLLINGSDISIVLAFPEATLREVGYDN